MLALHERANIAWSINAFNTETQLDWSLSLSIVVVVYGSGRMAIQWK